jgi:EmrB/QacA subfamily drug resistance transporter
MPKTHRPLAVVAVLLSIFMAALEATVVATAMPTVVGDLGGLELYGWVGSVYMVASTVTIPLYGKLADLYGRKPILYLGLALFLAGSMASGLSRTMTQLIAFRALQGVGAGGLQPVAFTIIGDLFTPQERAKIQGIFGAVWGVAGMAGPIVGGLIVKALSWRWVFYINVPFGVLSAAVLFFSLHEKVEKKHRELDLAGAALLATAILAALLGASLVSPALTLALAAISTAGFLWVEARAKEPILPLDLMKMPVIATSSVAAALLGGLMMATVIYVPLFVQAVLGGTPTDAGTAVAPMLVGWPIASATSGRLLSRVGMRPLVRLGSIIGLCASVGVAMLLAAGASLFGVRVAMFFFGVGLGCANTSLLIAVQQAVSWERRGVATASSMFFRSIGGALAVGVLGAVLANALPSGVPAAVVNDLLGPTHGRGLDPAVVAPLAAALDGALRTVFRALAGMAVLAVVAGMAFPRVELSEARRPDAKGGAR